MAALDKSIYEEIVITSPSGRDVDVAPGCVMIDYYEDLFSPVITAKLQIVNEGHSITGKDGTLESIYNGLPLRGGEKVSIKIKGNSDNNPGLDFTVEQFYVSSITNVLVSKKSESFSLNLTSRESLTNETSRVGKRYPTSSKISESVKDIIKNYLPTNKKVFCDPTQNTYGFIGNMRKPFTTLLWLASKSVPEGENKDSAGYLFYETKSGFHFKSVDSLIDKEHKAEYIHTEVMASEPANDFKILKYATDRSDDILGKLQRGSYCSHRIFFNPLTFNYTDPAKGKFGLEDYKGKSMGEEYSSDFAQVPSRFITAVMDIGTLEDSDRFKSENADPMLYQSQELVRYNSIFSKELSMTIPSNTNLEVGDLIECSFVRSSDEDALDTEQSGLYMIAALCHHFDTSGSYTVLNLIKDTFGPKAK
tara:strand:+ start:2974 stop:4233 length:1260 start_codon:yes stop_codon:yes gene_type:complete